MKTSRTSRFSIHLYLLIIGSITLYSCGSVRPTATSRVAPATADQGPRFLEDISVNPGERISSRNKSYGYLEEAPESSSVAEEEATVSNLSHSEKKLVDKYADLIGVPARKVSNVGLIEEIDDWYGTPYRYGGNSKKGVDCSAFSRTLANKVFNISLPRTAAQQYQYSNRIKKSQLEEGDLVFFHTTGRARITHVGIYLQNGKFVHASTSSGVMISDLDDSYWKKAYRGAGRAPKQ